MNGKKGVNSRGEEWRYLDISGDHLGARIEELAPGDKSSVHHYHSAEEEHVLVLDGSATLYLGGESSELVAGDHVWFAAGIEVPHHIENTSEAAFKFLVFGERNPNDVVVYPDHEVFLVKGLGTSQYTYRKINADE